MNAMVTGRRFFSFGFLIVAGLLSGDLVAAPVVGVSVDVQNPGKPLPKDLWGNNVDTEGPNPVEDFYWGLREFSPPVLRFPGGLVSNFYHWAQTLGRGAERRPQWNCFHQAQFAPLTGAAEYLALLNSLNAKGMITLNVNDGTPQEAAAWVAFCRGRIGDPRVIGKDAKGQDWKTVDFWAGRRYELTGIREPVNVLYWELGNEMTVKPETSILFARAIRSIDPNILIGIIEWDRNSLRGELGKAVDFVVYHTYTGLPRYDDRIMIWGSAASTMEDNLVQKFECPVEGEYEIEARAFGEGITPEVLRLGKAPQVSVKVDQNVLKTVTLSDRDTVVTLKTRLSAGPHLFKMSFLNDYYAPPNDTNVNAGRAFYVTKEGRRTEYFFPQVASQFRKDLDDLKKTFLKLDREIEEACPRLFIAVTEYNRGMGACFDLEAALYIAELQRFFTEVPRIRTAEIWEAIAGNFGITWTRNDLNVRRVRPNGYVFKMARELQERQIPVSLNPNNPDLRFLATKNSFNGDLVILWINLENKPLTVKFTGPDGKPLIAAEQKFIAGKTLFDNNEKNEKIALITQRIPEGNSPIPVPGYSIGIIKFQTRKIK